MTFDPQNLAQSVDPSGIEQTEHSSCSLTYSPLLLQAGIPYCKTCSTSLCVLLKGEKINSWSDFQAWNFPAHHCHWWPENWDCASEIITGHFCQREVSWADAGTFIGKSTVVITLWSLCDNNESTPPYGPAQDLCYPQSGWLVDWSVWLDQASMANRRAAAYDIQLMDMEEGRLHEESRSDPSSLEESSITDDDRSVSHVSQ